MRESTLPLPDLSPVSSKLIKGPYRRRQGIADGLDGVNETGLTRPFRALCELELRQIISGALLNEGRCLMGRKKEAVGP